MKLDNELVNTGGLGSLLVSSSLTRETVHVQAGHVIFWEGQPCGGVYVIRSGRVELSLMGPLGDAIGVRITGPEEAIGLVSAINGAPYCKTALALQETVLDRFSAADVVSLFQQYPNHLHEALSFLCVDAYSMQCLLAEAAGSFRHALP